MQLLKPFLIALSLSVTSISHANADIKVVTSIKPIHSLVSSVMQGVGTPSLIVDGANSPHNYALKPSQARDLQQADIVFWMGHDLEAFLESAIETIAKDATSVSLMDSHGITKLAFREGGAFDAHEHGDHDDHNEHGHDEHGHAEHNDHDQHNKHDDHDGHEGHNHGAFDPHLWLDPQNAKALVHEIEEHLADIDPANAALYEANAANLMIQLDELTSELTAELAPVTDKGYIVFHDAYQYFENRFGLSAVGAITISPEVAPGADRIRDLQEEVRHANAVCVFSEPQFQPKLAKLVTENTKAGTAILDPLGASLNKGPELYVTLIRTMAQAIKSCLSSHS